MKQKQTNVHFVQTKSTLVRIALICIWRYKKLLIDQLENMWAPRAKFPANWSFQNDRICKGK